MSKWYDRHYCNVSNLQRLRIMEQIAREFCTADKDNDAVFKIIRREISLMTDKHFRIVTQEQEMFQKMQDLYMEREKNAGNA